MSDRAPSAATPSATESSPENSRAAVSKKYRLSFPAPQVPAKDAPHATMWGFADSCFEVRAGAIALKSPRYDSGGQLLPNFAPFVQKAIGIAFDPQDRHEPIVPLIPQGVACEALVGALRDALATDVVVTEDSVRLRHGHGHHLEEIYEVLYGALQRIPDVVVYPRSDAEVQSILRLAQEHRALIVPYGGGTCVSMALSLNGEARPVISLDLGMMNRIEWLEPDSLTACIEAGAVGRVLEEQLREQGYTLGHEPDSIEFSTMGGWIATNASGMKKNRYGNIEDIVLDVTVVTADGSVNHPVVVPRSSHGVDMRRLIFGSEGLFGVITRAVVKVRRLPEVQEYGSLVFPSWQSGLSFMQHLSTLQLAPASVRLVDNMQFQFGRALKPASSSGLAQLVQKLFVTKVKGIDLEQMVACTLVYEGNADEQRALRGLVESAAKRYGGFSAGGAAGKDGYNLTFGIAYIRDFLLQYWTLGDSFETAVPWGKVNDVIDAVKEAVLGAHRDSGLSGHPFVTARVSQVYPTGCCVYFYIGFHYKNASDPMAAFRHLEHEARVAIVENGGALSHHHGIGKVRAPYLERIKSETAQRWVEKAQHCFDPHGIFANGNQGVGPASS